MKRIAIVVQRCHKNAVGGSEVHAWQYATLLRDIYSVDVLTTTALETNTWKNVLPAGAETIDGISVRRFPVTIGRSLYWHDLHKRLILDFESQRIREQDPPHLKWGPALQEEFIRRQGPYSAPLIEFLEERWRDYEAVIFLTYLYPTTYFGILSIPKERSLLVPTLHDEPPAYLSAYAHMARHVRLMLWNTEAEIRFATRLWGRLPGRITSMGIDTVPRSPIDLGWPYLLYCGRIDAHKGCRELIDYFIAFKKQYPSDLHLVLTGKDEIGIPLHPEIVFKGFVPEEEKFSLMAGATVFIMPSPYESLSVVLLEAMAQTTTVLVNGESEVLVDHITQSNGGFSYNSYETFSQAINALLKDRSERASTGASARDYVVKNYSYERIKKALIEAIEEKTLDDKIYR